MAGNKLLYRQLYQIRYFELVLLEQLWAARDPVAIQAEQLGEAERQQAEAEVAASIQSAFNAALAAEGVNDERFNPTLRQLDCEPIRRFREMGVESGITIQQ